MNDNIRGLTVSIGGNATQLGKALDGIRAKTSASAAELSQINRLLKFDPGNTELLAQKQKVLADKIAATKEKLTLLTEAQKQANEAVGSEKMTDANYRELQRAVVSAQQELSKLQNEADQTASAMSRAGKTTKESGEQAAAGVKKVAEESDTATPKVSSFGDTLKAVLASSAIVAGAKAIWNGIKKIGSTASEQVTYLGSLSDNAEKVGMSAENLQSWQYAAKMVGFENEQLVKTIEKQQKSFASAKTGSDALAESYATIGVDISKLNTSEEAFEVTIAALAECRDETTRNAVANDIFGRSYADLAPLLNLGSDGIRDLRNEAYDLSIVISNDTVAAGDALGDTLDTISQQVDSAKTKILAGAIPALQKYSTEIKRALGSEQAQKQLERTGKAVGDLAVNALSLGSKILPVLGNGLVFVSKNGKDLAITSAALLLTFKGFAIASKAKSLVTGLAGAIKGLNKTMAANPAGAVIAGLSGLISILGILDLATDSNTEKMERLSDAYREAADAATESQRRRAETYGGIQKEFDHYRDLVSELDTLVDADGNVLSGYEDRVNYILGELTAATGVEIDLIDGEIVKYGELKQTISDVILQKQAESFLSSGKGDYESASSAVKSMEKDDDGNYVGGSKAAAEEATSKYNIAARVVELMAPYQAEIDRLIALEDEGLYSNGVLEAQIEENRRLLAEVGNSLGVSTYAQAQEYLTISEQQMNDALYAYDQNMATIHQYETVQNAVWANDSVALSEALSTATSARMTAADATLSSLQRQVDTAKTEYDQYLEWSRQNGTTVTDADVAAKRESLIFAALELHKKLISEGDAHTEEEIEASRVNLKHLISTVSTFTSKEISQMISDAEKQAIEAGGHYVEGIVSGITDNAQDAYDAGYQLGLSVDQGYRDATETRSPSKVGRRSSQWYPIGVAQGIEDNADLPVKAVARMASKLNDALRPEVPGEVFSSRLLDTHYPIGYAASFPNAGTGDLQLIYGQLDLILASIKSIDPCLSIDGERMSKRLVPYTNRDLGIAAYNDERGRLQ